MNLSSGNIFLICIICVSVGFNVVLYFKDQPSSSSQEIQASTSDTTVSSPSSIREELQAPKVDDYKTIQDYGLEDNLEVPGGIVLDKNSIVAAVSYCQNLEGEIDYIYEQGVKVPYNAREDIVQQTQVVLSQDKDNTRIVQFNDMMKGSLTGAYAFVSEIAELDVANFEDFPDMLQHVGYYMLTLSDVEEFKAYEKWYLGEIKNIGSVSIDNELMIILSAHYKMFKNCKDFVQENIIAY